MCLDNANSLLDTKQVEFSQLKLVCEKLENSKMDLANQLETESQKYQDSKKKFDESQRLLDEKTAKDDLLADEIKVGCPKMVEALVKKNIRKLRLLHSLIYFKIHSGLYTFWNAL